MKVTRGGRTRSSDEMVTVSGPLSISGLKYRRIIARGSVLRLAIKNIFQRLSSGCHASQNRTRSNDGGCRRRSRQRPLREQRGRPLLDMRTVLAAFDQSGALLRQMQEIPMHHVFRNQVMLSMSRGTFSLFDRVVGPCPDVFRVHLVGPSPRNTTKVRRLQIRLGGLSRRVHEGQRDLLYQGVFGRLHAGKTIPCTRK